MKQPNPFTKHKKEKGTMKKTEHDEAKGLMEKAEPKIGKPKAGGDKHSPPAGVAGESSKITNSPKGKGKGKKGFAAKAKPHSITMNKSATKKKKGRYDSVQV